MPYISLDKRVHLDPIIEELFRELGDLEMDDDENNTEGNLNYVITRLLMLIYGNADGTRYSHINDAMGVLACVQAEFYRKVASPYEDIKESENGRIKRFENDTPEVVGTVEVIQKNQE